MTGQSVVRTARHATERRRLGNRPGGNGQPPSSSTWEQHFEELKAFKKQHGHCNVPKGYPPNPSLANWVADLRRCKAKWHPREIRRLDALGFVWQPHNQRWEEKYRALVQYKKKHGHCNVPLGYPPNPSLASWVGNIRAERKRGNLAPERIRLLAKIGFTWTLRNRRFRRRNWDVMVAALVDFRNQYGHCDVPWLWPENPELAAWLRGVRSTRRMGKLERRRFRQLDRLGVVWEPAAHRWQEMYAALVEYKRQHGDCNVPDGWLEDRALGNWVGQLRLSWKKGTLAPSKVEQLDQIGFAWNWTRHRWESMHAALAAFKEMYGHCRVSTLSKPHKELANWVHHQRIKKRQGRLSAEDIRQLDRLGFTWDVEQERWEAMFAALVDYRNACGDCDVPFQWPQNARLGHWVAVQRLRFRRGTLTGQQIQRLAAIGFRWRIRPDSQPRS